MRAGAERDPRGSRSVAVESVCDDIACVDAFNDLSSVPFDVLKMDTEVGAWELMDDSRPGHVNPGGIDPVILR